MFTREEIVKAAQLFAHPDDPVTRAEFQLLVARRMAGDKIEWEGLEELGRAAGELAQALAANPSIDVPATLSNLIRGITAQFRVACAVAQPPLKEV
jgi:hypothetical protein